MHGVDVHVGMEGWGLEDTHAGPLSVVTTRGSYCDGRGAARRFGKYKV